MIFFVFCVDVTFPVALVLSVIVTAVVQLGGRSVIFTVELCKTGDAAT